MATFSDTSLKRLRGVHADLQTLFNQVVIHFDCSVISGVRTAEEQQDLYAKGRTEDGQIVTYKDGVIKKSKHQLGLAVDVVPYPTLYKDEEIMEEFGKYVIDVATELKNKGLIDNEITWGGTWRFRDLPHFQI
jgi:peptidoglycan L-alanyl-D-glutamate endopeptidase CwlK